jgi:hypothetical protein
LALQFLHQDVIIIRLLQLATKQGQNRTVTLE